MSEYEKLAKWLKTHDRIPDKGKVEEIPMYKKWYATREAYYEGKLTKDMMDVFTKHRVIRFLGTKTPKEASIDTCATVLHRLQSGHPLTIPLINWLNRKRAAYAGTSKEVEIYDEELKLIVEQGRESLFGAPKGKAKVKDVSAGLKPMVRNPQEKRSNAQVSEIVAYVHKHLALPPTGTPLRMFYDHVCESIKKGNVYQSDLDIAKEAGYPDLFLDGFTRVSAEETSNEHTRELCRWLKGEMIPKSVREETKLAMWYKRKKSDYKKDSTYPNFFESDLAIATSYGFTGFFTADLRDLVRGTECHTADVSSTEFEELCDLFKKSSRLPGRSEKLYLRGVASRLSTYLRDGKLPEKFKKGLDEIPGLTEQLINSSVHDLIKPRIGALRKDVGFRMHDRNVKVSQAGCLRYCLVKKGLIDVPIKEHYNLNGWANRKKSGRSYMYQEDLDILVKFGMQEGFPPISEKYAKKP